MNEAVVNPVSRLCNACCKQFGMDCEPFKCGMVKVVEQLERERNAAVADLSSTTSACDFCSGRFCEKTPIDSGGCRFEWRGVQEHG